jgi:hypothetical protein
VREKKQETMGITICIDGDDITISSSKMGSKIKKTPAKKAAKTVKPKIAKTPKAKKAKVTPKIKKTKAPKFKKSKTKKVVDPNKKPRKPREKKDHDYIVYCLISKDKEKTYIGRFSPF